MKAPDFRYERPATLSEALAILGDDTQDATPLAGGQSLVPMMNFRIAQPETLVDLGALDELRGITDANGGLRIGAMTRYSDLVSNEDVARHLPLFVRAIPHIAHAAVRNRGTIGGSVALADPAAEMPAVLLALDATIAVTGQTGTRRIAADDFFLGLYETALEPDELITEIVVPARTPEDRFGFYELARRHGDYAMAGVAISVRGRDTVDRCRIAFFGVSDRAVRAGKAETALQGKDLEDGLAGARAALDELDFAADLNASQSMKRHLSGVVLERAMGGLS